ncbi:hypothetical protein LCGC14_2048580 [marine sediment metagenome]|uniref:Uncharacterized protein n=1 Tax=marine sediment metagenome TaxID=412755 RepID=A0A0F9EPT8_9ZZZZ
MGDSFSWLISNWGMLVTTLLAVVGGASVMVATISKVTKNKTDDKAAKWLEVVHKWLSKVAMTPTEKKTVKVVEVNPKSDKPES